MADRHSIRTTSDRKSSLAGVGAAYIRVSTDKQDTDRQYAAVRDFERQQGVKIPPHNWFKDEGYARDEADIRPDFQRMIRLAENNAFQWIVIDRLDRFGTKNEKQLISYLYRLEEVGCKLYDASGKCWSDEDIATIITAVIEAAKSKGEQIEKSHRSLGGKLTKAKDGEWMGGNPPFAIDVGCFARDTGKELWRVVFEGKDKRAKVFPDGRSERFDGKRNFPPTAVTEVLRYVPTRDASKLEALRTLFSRYVDESISCAALATWLNSLGHRNGMGGKFQGIHVQSLLDNPAYIGRYAYGKWAKGKFNHVEDGRIVHELNYALKAVRHSADKWQLSEQIYEPIIDKATWDKVQQKLQEPKRVNAPRSSTMIYSGLLHCGNCGVRMRSKAEHAEYFCGTWHRRSAKLIDHCECGRHPVKQDVIDRYVDEWLAQSETKLDMLVSGLTVADLAAPRQSDYKAEWTAFNRTLDSIARYLSKHHPSDYADAVYENEVKDVADVHPNVSPSGNAIANNLIAAYRSLFSPIELNRELARLTGELDQLTAKHLDLPPSAKRANAMVKDRMASIEGRMDELQAQLDNAADRAEQHLKNLRDIRASIAEAKAAVKKGGERSMRARAQALRRVIGRIDCHFEPAERTNGGYRAGATAASRLVQVVIYPVDGEPAKFQANMPSYTLDPVTTRNQCNLSRLTGILLTSVWKIRGKVERPSKPR